MKKNKIKKYEMDMIEIRSYAKSELAMKYFPDASSPEVANKRLVGWIKRCKELQTALNRCHQSKWAKFWSAEAVRQIVKYLGEP